MIRVSCNGMKFTAKHFVFSGGEVQTKLDFDPYHLTGKIDVVAHLGNSDDIMSLLQVVDIVRRSADTSHSISLIMPYAPYARQDRACAEGESLAASVFATLINTCGFDRVTVVDCHSDVLPALIDNCVNIPVEKVLDINLTLRSILSSPDTILISPDAGANKKVHSVAKVFGGLEVIRADKVRDTSTGQITGTEVYCDDLKGQHCLIIDDICDGGYTFIKLAEKLKEKNAGFISLYVTHGIFSKGVEVFDNLIDNIYTTDSFRNTIEHPKLLRIKI